MLKLISFMVFQKKKDRSSNLEKREYGQKFGFSLDFILAQNKNYLRLAEIFIEKMLTFYLLSN